MRRHTPPPLFANPSRVPEAQEQKTAAPKSVEKDYVDEGVESSTSKALDAGGERAGRVRCLPPPIPPGWESGVLGRRGLPRELSTVSTRGQADVQRGPAPPRRRTRHICKGIIVGRGRVILRARASRNAAFVSRLGYQGRERHEHVRRFRYSAIGASTSSWGWRSVPSDRPPKRPSMSSASWIRRRGDGGVAGAPVAGGAQQPAWAIRSEGASRGSPARR